MKNGLEAVNQNRLQSHAFITQDLNQIVTFPTNYAGAHAIQLPGGIKAFSVGELCEIMCYTHSVLPHIGYFVGYGANTNHTW